MPRLLLLRHAKSDWSEPGQSDRDRPLAARGRRTAPEIGAYMTRHRLIPDHVLCSTAQRTRQTLDLVAGQFPAPPSVTFADGLYEASSDGILRAIRAIRADVHTLLLIGHNPGLQDAATMLIASGDVEARERLKERLPTAGLAVIDFPSDDWGKVHRKAGRLERFVTPRTLETATD